MYYTDITNPELQYFHDLKVPNFSIKLSDLLTSGLFKVETIIAGSIYRVYPLFYTGEITSTNPKDNIIDNKCIVCKKEDTETYITFISNPDEDIQDYSNYATYFDIGDSLTTGQFNNIVELLRNNTIHSDNFELKQGTIDGIYGKYTFDIESTTIIDTGILITNETLTNLGTVKLTDNVFNGSKYVLKLKVYHMTDINVCNDVSDNNIVVETLEIELKPHHEVIIPFDTLDYNYVVDFNATVEITHTNPLILDWITQMQITSNKNIIQKNDKADISVVCFDSVNKPVQSTDIYFYEVYEPYSISIASDKSIIQTSETADITAKLKDKDGSLIEDETIYFYEVTEE